METLNLKDLLGSVDPCLGTTQVRWYIIDVGGDENHNMSTHTQTEAVGFISVGDEVTEQRQVDLKIRPSSVPQTGW